MTNPAYTGQVYAGRTRSQPARVRRSATHLIGHPHEGHAPTPPEAWIPVAPIPAIVTQAQFDGVQAKLAQNQSFARRNNKTHTYLLRALVSCGVCQSSCIARTVHARYDYYTCRAKGNPIQTCRDEKCSARYVPAHQLDELVWQDLCGVLQHPEIITHALERAHGGHWLPQELLARRENLRKGRISLEHQLDRLSEAYLQGVMGLTEYQRRRRELEQKAQALATQEQQLDGHVDRQAELAGLAASVESFCERVQTGLANATFEQKRQLVELLIDRVIVTNDQVEIRYVIPTSPSSEYTRFCHLRTDYFHNPSFGQDLKANLVAQFLDNLQCPAQSLLDPVDQLAPVATIGPDQFQSAPARELRLLDAFKQSLQQFFSPLAVLHMGRSHHHQQNQPKGIDNQMSLSPADFLARIITALVAAFDCLDGLAVQDGCARLFLPPGLFTDRFTQSRVEVLPGALQPPHSEGVISGFPRRQIARQHSPRATTAHNIENRVQDVAPTVFPRSASRLGLGHIWRNYVPFSIIQISRVGLLGFSHSTSLPDFTFPG